MIALRKRWNTNTFGTSSLAFYLQWKMPSFMSKLTYLHWHRGLYVLRAQHTLKLLKYCCCCSWIWMGGEPIPVHVFGILCGWPEPSPHPDRLHIGKRVSLFFSYIILSIYSILASVLWTRNLSLVLLILEMSFISLFEMFEALPEKCKFQLWKKDLGHFWT